MLVFEFAPRAMDPSRARDTLRRATVLLMTSLLIHLVGDDAGKVAGNRRVSCSEPTACVSSWVSCVLVREVTLLRYEAGQPGVSRRAARNVRDMADLKSVSCVVGRVRRG